MPLESFDCSICGKRAPKRLREHGKFEERMDWLRHHRKHCHGVSPKMRGNPNFILDLTRRF